MATTLGPNHKKPNTSQNKLLEENISVATSKPTPEKKRSVSGKTGKKNVDKTPAEVKIDVPNYIPLINEENDNGVPPPVRQGLPNQPTIPEAEVPIPRSSEVCSAAVKWKAKLSVHDRGRQSQGEAPLLDKNEVVPIGGVSPPRNHVTINTEGDNEAGASATRKLSLGDVVTQAVITTQQTGKWEDMEGSTTGLAKSLPYIPVSLAYTCLLLNVLIPGSGTIVAGFSMMCCGESRGNQPDDLFSQSTTNIFVGVSQFFTVSFFLAGWIWSISWGIYLVIFAEANKLRKAEEKKRNTTARIANTLWDR